MKIRTIKKLIAQYPPIIEIRIKEEILTAALHAELIFYIKNSIPNYLKDSLIFIILLQEPKGIFKIDPHISKASLKEFREEWKRGNNSAGLMTVNNDTKIEWIQLEHPSYVTIHSAITSTPFMYKKTLERLNNKIKEINM